MASSHIIITGALGGLGSAFAYEFASRGWNLTLVDQIPEAKALQVFLSETFEVDTQYYACDLANASDRGALIHQLQNQAELFSGLVNVVGQEIEGQFLTRRRDEVLTMLHLNIEAMVDLSLFALNQADKSQKFLLINVASLAGFFPIPHKAIYSASKRFIINFSLALREEIKDIGNVTVLCPGGLPTNPEAMKKIFMQGFWGKMTAHDVHHVVKKTIQKVQRNVPVYTPGISNRILVNIAKFIPNNWLTGYLSRRWRAKQKRLNFWRLMNQQSKK